ncbi:MAG: hypothetical protein AAGG51_19245 [Cyanobacteria bacterium P01_G01_bin.54]
MPTQRTLSCKVDENFLDQVDQYAQEQGLSRNDWVKQALQSFVSGSAAAPSDRSEQILQVLAGLNQRLARIEERDTMQITNADTAGASAPDPRIEQVLQWLQVIGQKLQRLEEKEEEPMITQAELIAPDERIDQIMQMMQGLGQQVQQLEAHTEDAIASLRPAIAAAAVEPPTTPAASTSAVPPVPSPPATTAPLPDLSAPPFQPTDAAQPLPAPDIPTPPAATSAPDTPAIELDAGLVSLEQLYGQTQLDRASIQFFANYLGISEIEALETRSPWEYDYIAGGFRRRQ